MVLDYEMDTDAVLWLLKPKELFLGSFVDLATEVLFRLAYLPKKTF
jgi:hypothetical protein